MTKSKIDSVRYYYAVVRKGLAYIRETRNRDPSGQASLMLLKDCAAERGIQIESFVDGTYLFTKDGKTWVAGVSVEKASTAWLCSNKYATFEYLKKYGFHHMPRYRRYSLATIEEAREDFRTRGNAVVVKPSRQTYGGTGVTPNIKSMGQLNKAIFNSLVYDSDFLMEDFVEGENYRVLCYKDKVLSVIHRIPAHVTGDGTNSIKRLIDLENERRAKDQGPSRLYPIEIDGEVRQTLLNKGLSLGHVPAEGERVVVRTVCNFHAGGTEADVTNMTHPDVLRDCQNIMGILDVTVGGIDIITRDITRPLGEAGGKINEVNTSPGLDGHGQDAIEVIVEGLYEVGNGH